MEYWKKGHSSIKKWEEEKGGMIEKKETAPSFFFFIFCVFPSFVFSFGFSLSLGSASRNPEIKKQ